MSRIDAVLETRSTSREVGALANHAADNAIFLITGHGEVTQRTIEGDRKGPLSRTERAYGA